MKDDPLMISENSQAVELRLKHLGIDTQREHIIYMNEDNPVCKSEGFEAQARIRVEHQNGSLLASLNIFRNGLLKKNEVALSEDAWRDLDANEGDLVQLSHPDPIESFGHVRSKIYGHELDKEALSEVINDIVCQRYSDIQISAFVTALAGMNTTLDETSNLTRAMIESGKKLDWDQPIVGDKHSLGGLPGNRTTPIVVAIVASCGVTIPKTSSRAITSPAGTADAMETMTEVNLDSDEIKEVVQSENGCFVWGGNADLSPADDILIQIERSLDIDSEGQMVASILSKKVATGSSHVVIDMPVGETAKIRSEEAVDRLQEIFEAVADKIGLNIKILPGNGTQPIGRGIGPALEARDVLGVLKNKTGAPGDLRERSLELAGSLLELTGQVEDGEGFSCAEKKLDSGQAWEKFQAICKAQGRFDEPSSCSHKHKITSPRPGRVESVDNRKLARVAKLAGAPDDSSAGVDYLVRINDRIQEGEPLFEIHSESKGELDYALSYVGNTPDIITIGDDK